MAIWKFPEEIIGRLSIGVECHVKDVTANFALPWTKNNSFEYMHLPCTPGHTDRNESRQNKKEIAKKLKGCKALQGDV